jgi:hypothetical protein
MTGASRFGRLEPKPVFWHLMDRTYDSVAGLRDVVVAGSAVFAEIEKVQ